SFPPYLIIYPPPLYHQIHLQFVKIVSPCKVAATSKPPDKYLTWLYEILVLTDFYPSFFFQYFRPDYSYPEFLFSSAPV
ncbi:hypothetical protein MM710_33625, partial [Klebsiella pneumoniae]|nr:hypothetical protein [Klebsiella pneumoniae]